jgi:glycosyltransferase involved in cell wall biosynthesis
LIDLSIRPIQLFRIIIRAFRSDAVYLQKTLLPKWFLKLIYSANPKIGFDFDDAIQEESPKNQIRIREVLKLASLVTVENRKNGDFSKQINGREPLYILGPIDCDRYTPQTKINQDKIVIGWVGSHSTSIYLDECKQSLLKLLESHQHLELHLVGFAGNFLNHPKCVVKQWKLDSECRDLGEFDIGIMPLPNTPWTQGKGGYKILQYMAMGIPSVVSPVGVNAAIIDNGINGFHANSETEWFTYLDTLVSSEVKRKDMGQAALKKAKTTFSFESYLPRFLADLKDLSGSSKPFNPKDTITNV